MPNTFSQIYIHVIFSVKRREHLIETAWKDDLQKYIAGIIRNKGSKLIAINNMPDHIHIFLELKPGILLSDLIREIKRCSTKFINNEMKFSHNFAWQDSFAAYSYSFSQIDNVCKYILNQENHHKMKTFHEEYLEFLNKYNVPYDPKYVFSFE